MYNLPNILTISRIVVIPVIFLSIYIHAAAWSVFAAVLFILAAVTDYFDGYLARARNQTSAFGRLLDPIADKLLVVSALLIIVANGMVDKLSYIPVVIILCREVLVSGLREFLAEVKIGMPVTRLAKWKTACQMTALSLILLSSVSIVRIGDSYISIFGLIGEILLWVAGVLTFMTGYDYFKRSLEYVKSLEADKGNVATKPSVVKKAVRREKSLPAEKKTAVAEKASVKKSVKKSAGKKTPAKKAAVKKVSQAKAVKAK